MLSVELRVETDRDDYIPYSFLVVTGPDGVERGYGFAPPQQNASTRLDAPFEETNHKYDSTTGKIPLTEAAYSALMSYINRTRDNSLDDGLPLDSQCTNWAFDALAASGIASFASPNKAPAFYVAQHG